MEEPLLENFLKLHANRIQGVLSGFDRIIFRGTLRSISYEQGMEKFLAAHHVLLKDFGSFAQRCTERLAQHAEEFAHRAERPYRYLDSAGISKEQVARTILAESPVETGLICVLSCVEPCFTFDVRLNASGKLAVVRRHRKCRFFYFYFIDREFGFMHVRLQSWLPFDLQVYVNGRTYLARQMDRAGIQYEQRGNCFTAIDDLPRAQALLDRLERREWPRTLAHFASRVNPLLQDELAGLFPYYWTTREAEFATDVMFPSPSSLAALYPALVEHAALRFSSPDILRYLGHSRPGRFVGCATTDLIRRREGARVKHFIHENSIKMYDKEHALLRVETTFNNPRRFQVLRSVRNKDGTPALAWQKMRKGVSDFYRLAELGRAANARYLDALAVVGCCDPSHRILDPVSKPVIKDGNRHRGLRPIDPLEAAVFQAIMHGEHLIHGFGNGDLQSILFPEPARTPQEVRKRSSWTGRMLRLLRSHRLIHKVSRKRLYRITKRGHEVMATAVAFRNSNVALLQAKIA